MPSRRRPSPRRRAAGLHPTTPRRSKSGPRRPSLSPPKDPRPCAEDEPIVVVRCAWKDCDRGPFIQQRIDQRFCCPAHRLKAWRDRQPARPRSRTPRTSPRRPGAAGPRGPATARGGRRSRVAGLAEASRPAGGLGGPNWRPQIPPQPHEAAQNRPSEASTGTQSIRDTKRRAMGLSAQGPFRGFVAEGRAGGPRPVIPGSPRPRPMTYPERSSLFVPVEKSLLWWLTWGTPFGPTPQRYRAGRSVALGLIGPFPACRRRTPFAYPSAPSTGQSFAQGGGVLAAAQTRGPGPFTS